MNCRETQAELSAYLDGEVTQPVRVALERHLVDCAACRQRLAELRRVAQGVAALPQLTPAPEFVAEVRARIAGRTSPPPGQSLVDRWFRPVWVKVPLEALAVVAVALTVVWLQRPAPQTAQVGSPTPWSSADDRRVAIVPPPVTVTAEERAAGKDLTEQLVRRQEAATTRESTTERQEIAKLAAAKLDAATAEASPVPTPPVIAPAAPAAAGSEADRLTPAEVAQVISNQVVPGPIVIVQAGDLTKMRRQVETVATRLGGYLVARPEAELTENGVVAHVFHVRLPAEQVGNFANQLEPVRVRPRASRMIAAEIGDRAPTTSASAAVLYPSRYSAGAGKPQPPVEVEVRIIPVQP